MSLPLYETLMASWRLLKWQWRSILHLPLSPLFFCCCCHFKNNFFFCCYFHLLFLLSSFPIIVIYQFVVYCFIVSYHCHVLLCHPIPFDGGIFCFCNLCCGWYECSGCAALVGKQWGRSRGGRSDAVGVVLPGHTHVQDNYLVFFEDKLF